MVSKKQLSRARILFGSIFFCLLLTGFGCKGLSGTEQAATKPITLEYWTVFDDVDALQKMIATYRSNRPYITVNLRQLRADEFYPRLLEALAEDRGPDIVSVSNRSMRALKTKLAPMPESVPDTTMVTTEGTIGSKTTITTVARPLPNALQVDREYVQTVKKDVVMDGKVYGLPLSLDTMALYYNKDLLDRAGVAEPPKTWEEFQAAVKKISKYDKDANKITQAGAAFGTGNNITASDDLIYLLFEQSGVSFISKTGNQPIFNLTANRNGEETPAMTVMNFYTDFANPTRDTYTWNESMGPALDAFTSGSAAFFFGYSYHLPVIRARAPQLNVGVLPLLQLDPARPVNVANYYVDAVTLKSTKQSAAWAFINYLTHSSATETYLTETKRPTALRSNIKKQSEDPDLAPFVGQLLIADNWYRGQNYDSASRAIRDMIHEWLQAPPDPNRLLEWRQDILNRAAAKIQQTL